MKKTRDENALIEEQALKAVYHNLVGRLEVLCYIIAAAMFAFGIGSTEFIKIFDPSITLFDNLWPRILFVSLPFLALGQMMRRSTISDEKKTMLFIWSYSILFSVTASIYVWPLALQGNPSIFLYVAGGNTAYICGPSILASIPKKHFKHFIAGVMLFIFIPILTISFLAGDMKIWNVVISDTLMAVAVGIGFGIYGAKLHWSIEYLKAKHKHESGKYLGETLKKAIYEDKTELIEEKECTAYIFMMDIRDSTNLTRKYGERWSEFNKAWLSEALDIIRSHGGMFVKSTGDGLLAAFGLFDDENLLEDIPGLEDKNKEADEARWIGLTVDTYGCLETLMNRFEKIAAEHFPEEVIRIACGLDRGKVHRGVRGANNRREFDIWGDKVNTAAKLEAFSKSIAEGFGPDSSLLVISPYAADFLDSLDGFQKVDVTDEIRGSLHGIRWVLVRSYRNNKVSVKKSA